MQFFKVTKETKLSDVSQIIGSRNVDHLLAVNDLPRTPRIGQAMYDRCQELMNGGANKARKSVQNVSWQRKSTVLNTFCQDSDVFEMAALSSESAWRVLDALGTLPMYMKVPESVKLPDSTAVIGNGVGVSKDTYRSAMNMLQTPPHYIDPVIFNDYSAANSVAMLSGGGTSDVFEWFRIPWGEVTLYSALGGDSMDFPVYPEEYEDSRVANYTTMPDLIYQYEPSQIYTGSGPRQNKFSFTMHRDMWTGDHRDGKCNQLIRFCEANCYAEYNGSAVNTPRVTLYIGGKSLISGIMTDCTVSWDGPIGLDGWYLHCTLTFNIIEVSEQALNYKTVRNLPLIG